MATGNRGNRRTGSARGNRGRHGTEPAEQDPLIEGRLRIATPLWIRHYRTDQVMEAVNAWLESEGQAAVSYGTIRADRTRVLERWRSELAMSMRQTRDERIMAFRTIIRECWRAYDDLAPPRRTRRVELEEAETPPRRTRRVELEEAETPPRPPTRLSASGGWTAAGILEVIRKCEVEIGKLEALYVQRIDLTAGAAQLERIIQDEIRDPELRRRLAVRVLQGGLEDVGAAGAGG